MPQDSYNGAAWGGHLLLVHRSEPERRATVAAWVRDGLASGEKVIYAEPAGEPAGRSLLTLLEEHGLDAGRALADEQLSILRTEDVYPPGGQDAVIRQALDEGYPAVRVSAEASAALSLISESRFLELEHQMEDLCRTLPVSAMCQYDTSVITGRRLADAVASHPGTVWDHQLRLRQVSGRILVDGEVDIADSELLSAALERMALDHDSSLTIDLGGLDFIGVEGCRALLLGTERFREAGGHVFLEAAKAHVTRTLLLVGLHRQPHVCLVR